MGESKRRSRAQVTHKSCGQLCGEIGANQPHPSPLLDSLQIGEKMTYKAFMLLEQKVMLKTKHMSDSARGIMGLAVPFVTAVHKRSGVDATF